MRRKLRNASALAPDFSNLKYPSRSVHLYKLLPDIMIVGNCTLLHNNIFSDVIMISQIIFYIII